MKVGDLVVVSPPSGFAPGVVIARNGSITVRHLTGQTLKWVPMFVTKLPLLFIATRLRLVKLRNQLRKDKVIP